jgi:hypothetical protein
MELPSATLIRSIIGRVNVLIGWLLDLFLHPVYSTTTNAEGIQIRPNYMLPGQIWHQDYKAENGNQSQISRI